MGDAMALLTDQVCIVSGAGQGLGRTVALEMAAEGATVALLERNADTVRKVATEIGARGGRAEAYEIDVTDYAAYGGSRRGRKSTCASWERICGRAATGRSRSGGSRSRRATARRGRWASPRSRTASPKRRSSSSSSRSSKRCG